MQEITIKMSDRNERLFRYYYGVLFGERKKTMKTSSMIDILIKRMVHQGAKKDLEEAQKSLESEGEG
jgi:hypothetical protein